MSTDYSATRDRNFQLMMRNLRDRAEKQRERLALTTLGNTLPETQHLIQELQVHQIELEMQYEELLATQAETESVRARYLDLFDFAPVGYVTLDVLGMVRELNLHGAKLLGTARHRITNRRFLQFIAPDSREAFLRLMIDVLATDDPITLDVDVLRDDDTPLRIRLDGLSLPDPTGTRLCRLALTDLTAEHIATTAHRTSEARFQRLLTNSPDGMLLVRQHQIVAANAAAARLLGAPTEAALIGCSTNELAPATQPDGRASTASADHWLAVALQTGHARFEWVSQRRDTGAPVGQEVTLLVVDQQETPALVLATLRALPGD